jgi:hypothetical protein
MFVLRKEESFSTQPQRSSHALECAYVCTDVRALKIYRNVREWIMLHLISGRPRLERHFCVCVLPCLIIV